mmetsp:Transcript_15283/g.30978  ORF Transcript_15283/g.30978 Transcript_15283/m.30978 type:complete len:228 (-) Transcript_15283:1023-1706(-)
MNDGKPSLPLLFFLDMRGQQTEEKTASERQRKESGMGLQGSTSLPATFLSTVVPRTSPRPAEQYRTIKAKHADRLTLCDKEKEERNEPISTLQTSITMSTMLHALVAPSCQSPQIRSVSCLTKGRTFDTPIRRLPFFHCHFCRPLLFSNSREEPSDTHTLLFQNGLNAHIFLSLPITLQELLYISLLPRHLVFGTSSLLSSTMMRYLFAYALDFRLKGRKEKPLLWS